MAFRLLPPLLLLLIGAANAVLQSMEFSRPIQITQELRGKYSIHTLNDTLDCAVDCVQDATCIGFLVLASQCKTFIVFECAASGPTSRIPPNFYPRTTPTWQCSGYEWRFFLSRYRISDSSLPWEDESLCSKAGGRLAAISNKAEMLHVESFTKNVSFLLYIGAQNSDGKWKWIPGNAKADSLWKFKGKSVPKDLGVAALQNGEPVVVNGSIPMRALCECQSP